MERPLPASIPTTPGIYMYKDAGGRIVYVGKARNLRKRVLSYFRDPAALPSKTTAMLSHAVTLETLSTGTEKEALLLESSLIKKHRPHYNIVLRDDKQYVLFRIARNVAYPRLEVVRQTRKDGARYFGPFTSGMAARETWKSIHRMFPLRRCADRAFRNRVRPCLYYHLSQCLAPCTQDVPPLEYATLVQRVDMLLSGRSRELIDMLTKTMHEAAEDMAFEKAAVLRDQIRAVERTIERQSVVLPEGGDMDVAGIVPVRDGLGLGLLFIREGRLVDGRSFFWSGLELEDGPDLLWSFLSQFYGPGSAVPPRIVVPWLPCQGFAETGDAFETVPSEIGAPEAVPETARDVVALNTIEPETAVLEAVLSDVRGSGVRVTVPRNASEWRLVEMAGSNARESARQRDEVSLALRLGNALQMDRPAERVECVDVSHTGGRSTRVGMVVFDQGQPLKSEYRTYAIADEDGGGDDFASLAAWMRRRLAAGPPWADLVLVDGGRGQISAVLSEVRQWQAGLQHAVNPHGMCAAEDSHSIDRLKTCPGIAFNANPESRFEASPNAISPPGQASGAQSPPHLPGRHAEGLPFALAGIAKARDDAGRPDRRAGNVGDRIFLPGRSNPLPLRDGSPELLFLQHVRDTAHHFVLGRHRKARAEAAFAAELLRVPGVGAATAKLLWQHFASLEDMVQASPEALAAVPGIGPRKAEVLARRLKALQPATSGKDDACPKTT